MLHRIRLAMENGCIEKLSGNVEADETYIGGYGQEYARKKAQGSRQIKRFDRT